MLPLIVAALSPFIKSLFSNGLGILGDAVLAKGKDKIEETLGVKLPSDEVPPTPEQLNQLRSLQFQHEEVLLELGIRREELLLKGEDVAQAAVTERWKADMLSDSWLSKNIRPLILLSTICTVTIFAIMSAAHIEVNLAYIQLFSGLLTTMVGAYFVGRSVEKGIDIYQGWKQTKGE